MRILNALPIAVALVGCASQQAAEPTAPVFVTRVVNDCSWIPAGTYSTHDTQLIREWMVGYEKARRKNCLSR
ncbi:hypothetical protein [Burkholderia sp. WSM2232]|uniref:hypothetical protein n=1 Tax=Burkholderia sp. WSM2232 TaxID=944436 RepID=UPI000406D497|nr:hypothetical protein [Burkholderia sp. WSM2232]